MIFNCTNIYIYIYSGCIVEPLYTQVNSSIMAHLTIRNKLLLSFKFFPCSLKRQRLKLHSLVLAVLFLFLLVTLTLPGP